MKRKVECQIKIETVVAGRGPTPDNGEVAPDVEKHEFSVLFYDVEEDSHRNAYQIVLTSAEAEMFEIGKTYTLTIG